MLTSEFARAHKLDHVIDETSPELLFLRHLCQGGDTTPSDMACFFTHKTFCGRDVVVDAPNGKFSGLDAISAFASTWLDRAHATSATVVPCIQTIANGRAVSEIEVWFEQRGGQTLKVPMAVFGDLAPGKKLEGLRLYYFYQFIPGTPAYRRPIFRPTQLSWMSLPLLTGVVRHYYEQLHNGYTDEALQKIMAMMTDDIRYGGYRPAEVESVKIGPEGCRPHYEGICDTIPRDQYIRFETVTDDGVNCLVEWTSVVRMTGQRQGVVSQGGMAAYERSADGLLSSVRICDNLGWEKDMDRDTISPDDMFIVA